MLRCFTAWLYSLHGRGFPYLQIEVKKIISAGDALTRYFAVGYVMWIQTFVEN
jgi:hypothetical protein